MLSVTITSSSADASMRATASPVSTPWLICAATLAAAGFLECRRGVAERAGGVDDVIDNNAAPSLDVANDVHHLGYARAFAPLIDDREIGVKPLGDAAGRG